MQHLETGKIRPQGPPGIGKLPHKQCEWGLFIPRDGFGGKLNEDGHNAGTSTTESTKKLG